MTKAAKAAISKTPKTNNTIFARMVGQKVKTKSAKQPVQTELTAMRSSPDFAAADNNLHSSGLEDSLVEFKSPESPLGSPSELSSIKTELPSSLSHNVASDVITPYSVLSAQEIYDPTSFNGIRANNPFFKQLTDDATLPGKFKLASEVTISAGISFIFATMVAGFYIKTAEDYGILAQIGGTSVNFLQSEYYGIETYFFIKESILNIQQVYVRFVFETLIAILATLPPAFAAYLTSKELVLPILTFLGTLTQNIFGISGPINRLSKYLSDNPQLRNFLKAQLREVAAPNLRLKQALSREQGRVEINFGRVVGAGFAYSAMAGQIGYVCSSTRVLEAQTSNTALQIIGTALTNIPPEIMALVYCGFDIGRDGVKLVGDLYSSYRNPETVPLSSREKKYLIGRVVSNSAIAFLAYNSSATSVVLFDNQCNLENTVGGFLNANLRFQANYGAMLLNGVMGAKVTGGIADGCLKAYAPQTEPVALDVENDKGLSLATDRETYIVAAAEQRIDSLDINTLQTEYAETFFADRRAEWEAPARKSFCQRINNLFGLFGQRPAANNDDEVYQQLENGENLELAGSLAPGK